MAEERTFYYDADGNEVQSEAEAVHGIRVEVDAEGNTLRELERFDIGSGPGSGYSGGAK